ncbi:MAG: response regulator [Ghiorsea sp.]|nr:response regulator [Ghiorsea sp.]
MILLVDDDKSILNINSQLLEHKGFKVSAHLCAKQALTAFSQQPKTFKAIITDQNMPNMTGLDLIASAEKIKPDTKAILYTGMPSKSAPEHITILLKPARIEQIISLLNRL